MKKIKSNPNQLIFDFTSEELENYIDNLQYIAGCMDNIKLEIPKLFDTQLEDAAAIEKRFIVGKGYMITNGTGTGKTLVGLALAKRFYNQGKKNIIIVTPTYKKCCDWIEEAKLIDLHIYKLLTTKDSSSEVIVTTYANFYQNKAIENTEWDLIIYDESHYLNQNAQGVETFSYVKHKILSNVPSEAEIKAKQICESYYPDKTLLEDYRKDHVEYSRQKHLYNEKVQLKKIELIEKTKVLFLSATPFAYHKSIKYIDGCLIDINESIESKEDKFSHYNESTGFDDFLVKTFGYRMMYNKVTIPESGVDVNLLERQFFEEMKLKGVMSTRQLKLKYDYSRTFIEINSDISDVVNKFLMLTYDEEFRKDYKVLSRFFSKKYNYIFINKMIEALKAGNVSDRISQHLKLNRKVVVFHSYNNNNLTHPFRFEVYEFLKTDDDLRDHGFDLQKDINRFERQYQKYWNLDLSYLNNSIDSIKESYPNAGMINGKVSKKKRSFYIDEFNKDNSGLDVLIVQQSAGKEGISLHDKFGNRPRVIVNIGLPVQPVMAIQIEGRIYREGLKSNSIYEYMVLKSDIEKLIFATKIAERSRTVENLALGEIARNMEEAFKDGYMNSDYFEPSLEQGTGGVENDRNYNAIDEFHKAITYYYKQGKVSAKNKSRKGVDYYSTPEPLGYKMVEWLAIKNNEKVLEPSAGHGAIGRFFPGHSNNHFVEPSFNLFADLSLNASGTFNNVRFEDYSIQNKFDKIAMNPPFGSGGATAMEHISKAVKHLEYFKGELLSIIPLGPSMDKKLQKFLEENEKKIKLTGEIILPSCVFERAGTSVFSKIIRIERNFRQDYKPFQKIDLAYVTNMNDFFNEIENLDF